MFKKIFFVFVFAHLTFSLIAQTGDSVSVKNNSQVIIMGVRKLDNLAELLWMPSFPCLHDGKYQDIFFDMVTKEDNIKTLLSLYDNRTLKAFDTNCYYIPEFYTTFQYKYILPNVSEEYLPMLLKTYPKGIHPGATGDIYGAVVERGENYRIRNILHKTFLLVLVDVSIINEYLVNTISPASVLYCNDKAETVYIKVLIPLLDDEE